MGSIDGIDIVSLLLGAALAYAASITIGKRWLGPDVPAISRVLVVVGLALLIGYSVSEIVHALQKVRG